jgi:hypothetical protein
MSNRHVQELSRVCECLLRDAAQAFPALVKEFERDLNRLRHLVKHRGLTVFTVDFPAVCKHLDRCLAEGQYNLSCLPTAGRINTRVVIPKFLRGLYLLVFDEDGSLKEDCDPLAVFFLRQILAFGKKTELDCSEDAKDREVQEFLDLDIDLPEPGWFWNGQTAFTEDVPDHPFIGSFGGTACDAEMSAFLGNLDKLSGFLTSSLGAYHPEAWRFRHGPGAIAESAGITNKYYWRSWSERLESCYPIADYGFHSFSSWAGRAIGMGTSSKEPSSRLICVRKTVEKPRLIAAEPASHQWCQQNIWHYFCARVKDSWIGNFVRFRDQTFNQDLCLKASRGGMLATLDLSSASDRVTCQAVEGLFRANPPLLRYLMACRTRVVKLPSGKLHRLRKFATMGSAVTFPVESLLFLAVALAATLTKREARVTLENIQALEGEVAVFGDDLIVPEDSRDLVVRGLEALRFKVNTAKSYWTGRFRESCGVDAFQGVPVTPAYWKGLVTRSSESVASTVAVHNNFILKYLMNAAQYIASTVRGASVPLVSADSEVMGLKSRCSPPISSFKSRWNRGLQRLEVRLPVLIARVRKTPVHDDTGLLQFFTESPGPFNPWTSGVAQRSSARLSRRWVPAADVLAQGTFAAEGLRPNFLS